MRTALCLLLAASATALGREPAPPPRPVAAPRPDLPRAERPGAVWTHEMQDVADGNNDFAFDLYRELSAKPGNVFLSPYSVHAALAMVADGAKGPTRAEMAKVLRLPADPQAALVAGDALRYYATSGGGDGTTLSLANALWVVPGFPWHQEFLERQARRFGARLREAEFARHTEPERQRINQWVEEETRGRVKELLAPGVVTAKTTLVLTNAIYFKGEWAAKFDPKETRDEPFTLADGTKTKVPMMHRTGPVRLYSEAEDDGETGQKFKVAEFPYKGGDLSMVVVLPGAGPQNGLAGLMKHVTPASLNGWLTKAVVQGGVEVQLPKFRIETPSVMLNQQLITLGMPTAFAANADFEGMAKASPGALGAVVHKAFVEVNEEGTEAAAATAAATARGAPPSFLANRPFLFLIRDSKHGTILFMGRYEKP